MKPQKKAQAGIKDAKDSARYENSEVTKLCERLATLLQRTHQALQPDNLYQMRRPEIQEVLLVLEEMKMLVSEVEVIRLFPK